MKIQEVVGQQVRRARRAKGWTQADLGEALGRHLPRRWSSQVVSQAEKGEREFTAAELVALALVLDGPLPSFFMYEGESIELPNGSVPAFDVRMLLVGGNFPAEVAEALTRDTKRLEEQVSEQVRRLNALIAQRTGGEKVAEPAESVLAEEEGKPYPDQPPAETAAPVLSALLSAEETEVLQLIAFGQTREEIAKARGVPPEDVKAITERVFAKLRPPPPVENETVPATHEGGR